MFNGNPNKISLNGLELLKVWEGTGPIKNGRYQMYKDVAGYPTIGVGHLLTQQELASHTIIINSMPFNWMAGLDENQVITLLSTDCFPAEQAVFQNVNVQLKQNQFDALAIFTFNVGVGSFNSSTLLKMLNQGQYDQIPAQLMRWNKSGGQVVQGLINRRQNEINLWNS